jgi:hypothetical protein
LSAFLSTSLPEYSFVIVGSITFSNVHKKNPASVPFCKGAGAGLFGVRLLVY